MSEFNCLEPGCDYRIGITGVIDTEEDFEQQDYYFQEIEEHQQMHEESKASEKQSDYWVKVEAATAAWLDSQGIMQASQDAHGETVPNQLHVPGKTLVEALPKVGVMLAKQREEADQAFTSAENEYNKCAVDLANKAMVGQVPEDLWSGFLVKRDNLVRANGVVIGLRDLGHELLTTGQTESSSSSEAKKQS